MWADGFTMDPQLIRDYFYRFLYQPQDREYPDLCQLPDLNEQTLLDNLRARFLAGHIYTYVGSILIAVNPFKVINIKYFPHLLQATYFSVNNILDDGNEIYIIFVSVLLVPSNL